MQPAGLLSRILAVQPVLDAVERDQVAPRTTLDQLTIGQAVSGRVLSQTNGVALVEIAGQTVSMRLPRPVADGDMLKLRFAGRNPQPVFVLDTPAAPPADAPQFSPTARLLSAVVQDLPQRALPTLTPALPVLDAPSANPAQLAYALRTALVRSGLFYESHLADWVVGHDSLEGLLQEPQNRLAADRSAAVLAAPNPAQSPEAKSVNPLHTLMTQQLQVLEAPVFAWKGELWPGQTVEWQLRQEEDSAPPGTASADASEAGWESRLKLTLPHLGTVTIELRLDARHTLSVDMAPDLAATAPLLQRNQANLAERLAAAGCTLASLKVHGDGDA